MNYVLDIVFLLCLGWGAYRGFRNGFIVQSFALISLALAIWGAFAFAGRLEPFLHQTFKISELACSIVSFVLVFLVILLVVYISGFLVTKIMNAVSLGMINRLSGAAFGIFTNALLLSVMVLLFNRVNDNKRFVEPEILNKTHLYEPIGKVAPAIFPDDFLKIFIPPK